MSVRKLYIVLASVPILLGFFYVLGLFVIEPHSNVVLADVELAQTTEQLKSGLSNRKFLGENHGMLFVFENAGKHSFWMKDMNFPVDIIWIDSDNKVIDITKDAQPCGLDECEIYRAPSAVKYVLELPAGFSQKHSIETGKAKTPFPQNKRFACEITGRPSRVKNLSKPRSFCY
jgi:uncharacterized membrane protein (UPF0127 family)